MSCTLNSDRELSLVLRAVTCHTLRQDLAALRNELAKTSSVLVIDYIDLISAESTNLSSGTSLLHAAVTELTSGCLRCSIFSHGSVISFRKIPDTLCVLSLITHYVKRKL